MKNEVRKISQKALKACEIRRRMSPIWIIFIE